jgi:hypothetical protein
MSLTVNPIDHIKEHIIEICPKIFLVCIFGIHFNFRSHPFLKTIKSVGQKMQISQPL